MNISLRQLRAFTAVAQLGSFAEAARALHVTPAALSIVVRDLETTLGFRLFDRTTRRVTMTEVGQQYFHYAEQVLVHLRRAEVFAQDLTQHKAGVVRIATTQVVTWTLLPQAFAAFHRQWPQIRVEPIDIPTDQIIGAVEDGRADLAINFHMAVPDSLEATTLFNSRVHAVCAGTHRFARRKTLRWRDLQDESILFVGRGSELRIRSELPQDIALRSRYEVGNTSTALALAATGDGVVICAGYVRPMTRIHNLRIIPLAAPAIVHPFMLYRNRARSLTPAVQQHRAFLLDYFAQAGDACVEERLLPR